MLEFRNNVYIYLEHDNCFTTPNFELFKYTNKEIHHVFERGISTAKEYNYCLNKFDLNRINMENKSFINIFIGHLFQPLYLYQIFSISIWYYTGYYSFAGITVFMISVILLTVSYQTFNNYRKILTFSLSHKCSIQRNLYLDNCQDLLKQINVSSLYIVPGDIIEVKSGEMMPCDAIILEGIFYNNF